MEHDRTTAALLCTDDPTPLGSRDSRSGERSERLWTPGGNLPGTSTRLSEMQAGWRDPSRFVLGHPLNPPHLLGPTMLLQLGAARAALPFCRRYAESFHCWWDDLGWVKLDPGTVERLVAGVTAEEESRTRDELCASRDAPILATLKATTRLRRG